MARIITPITTARTLRKNLIFGGVALILMIIASGSYEAWQDYRAALAQGNADVLTFYTAQGTLAQKRIEVIKLKQQLIENWIALEIASGRYLPIPNPATRPIAPVIDR